VLIRLTCQLLHLTITNVNYEISLCSLCVIHLSSGFKVVIWLGQLCGWLLNHKQLWIKFWCRASAELL